MEDSIVLDNGTTKIRAGVAGEDFPKSYCANLVSRSKLAPTEYFFGDEAIYKRGSSVLTSPIQNGIIVDWDSMERLWQYVFVEELCMKPEAQGILLSEPSLNPKANREKTTQIMFETFGVPGMYLANKALLSLFASGRGHGLVLDIGEGTCSAVPVVEGLVIHHLITNGDVNAKVLTDYFGKLLAQRGLSFEREIIADMKEKTCCIALHYEDKMKEPADTILYELPDGNQLEVGKERYQCTESLFQPSLLQDPAIQCPGIHHILHEVMKAADEEVRSMCRWNLLVTGGTSFLRGFVDRLTKELGELPFSKQTRVRCNTPSQEYTWIGGSILASLSTFQTMVINKEAYEEHGPRIVNWMCF